MNWSRSTKAVAATAAVGVVGGIYLLMNRGTNDDGTEWEQRDDIDEESITSEDEARLEAKDQTGHGDQASGGDGNELDEIEQLLHLLRVSLRVKQNEKTHNAMCVALRELAIRTRYAQNVEAMLDSG